MPHQPQGAAAHATAANSTQSGAGRLGRQAVVDLGVAVRSARHQLGITQAELGRRAHVRRELISQIERGQANPTFDTVAAIAAGLGVRLSDLADARPSSEERL